MPGLAQETYNAMLRERIAPALRALGLHGSGRSFALPSDTHFALLGLQTSKWSDSNSVRFTINVTVVGRAIWVLWHQAAPYYGERPSANTRYSPGPRELDPDTRAGCWQQRIGDLMPEHRDHFFQRCVGASDLDAVGSVQADALVPLWDVRVEPERADLRCDGGLRIGIAVHHKHAPEATTLREVA